MLRAGLPLLRRFGGRPSPPAWSVHEKDGRRVVTYWHVADKARLVLPDGLPTFEAENMKTWVADLAEREVVRAFASAMIGDP